MKEPFSINSFLDFHTHRVRHSDEMDVTEIVSIHLGQDKEVDYFTVGLHPWWTEEVVTPDQEMKLHKLLQNPKCLAMGEMGLDNLKGPEMSLQMDILRSQLNIAEKHQKPVIIHCVRAYDQLLKVKREFPAIKKWCIHGFGRNTVLAKQLIDQGFYLSIMPTRSEKYQEYFSQLPNDRLFLETDSMPDTSIKDIYVSFSEVCSITVEHLCDQMNQNAKAFFGHE